MFHYLEIFVIVSGLLLASCSSGTDSEQIYTGVIEGTIVKVPALTGGKIMRLNFDNGDSIKATGAEAALPTWAELMKAIPHHISESNFRVPDGIVKRVVCTDGGNAFISKNCPQPYEEYFLVENAPQESIHRGGQPSIFDRLIKGIKDLFKGD